MCVYGMEGPGGYQFVGRTVQMWNRFRTTPEFEPGRPWLLRFFDQIRFTPISGPELLEFRADFAAGRRRLDIEDGVFRLADYRRFLVENADGIKEAKARQQAAFDAERARWEASGELGYEIEPQDDQATETAGTLDPGQEVIKARSPAASGAFSSPRATASPPAIR